MASNKSPFVKNLFGAPGALIRKGKFQAGSTQAIKAGELLELSGGNFVPLTSDKSMAGTVAIANEEIKAGDLAGYYEIVVPRPGDVFEFELEAAAASGIGAAVYVVDESQKVTTTTGSNVLGHVYDHGGVPGKQGHLTAGDLTDAGTTIASTSHVHITIKEGASYWNALQGDDA